jgi:AcrR family transcriptional regulator
MAPSDAQIRRGGAARERILETAYDLFSRRGTRAVGVDTIIAESGVAKMTLYRNFASKDDLILEFLRQRDEREDFEGCAFISVMLELDDRESRVRVACVEHLSAIRGFVGALAEEAGVPPEDAAHVAAQWHILMKGSIVAAAEGDTLAAARARELGALLLAHLGVL